MPLEKLPLESTAWRGQHTLTSFSKAMRFYITVIVQIKGTSHKHPAKGHRREENG